MCTPVAVRALATLTLIVATYLPASAMADSFPRVPEIHYKAVPAEATPTPQSLLEAGNWQRAASSPNMGYDSRAYWFRFSLQAPESGRVERITRIGYPQLDDVRFLLFRNGELETSFHTGDRKPFSERPIQHAQFLFPTSLEAGNDYEVLIRVETSGAVQLPLQVWEPNALFARLSLQDQAHALYYGILMVVILFNLFIFLALRERTYLYYTLAITSYLLLMATLRGTAFAVLWPGLPWLHHQMMLATVPAGVLFSSLFVRAFLRLNRNNPVLDGLAKGAISMGVLALIGAFVLDYSLSIRFSVILTVPAFLLLLSIGPIEWARGNRAAKFYTVAWAALSLGSSLAAMNKLGWVPNNFITEYGIEIGSALEAMLLTVALAERLYRERHERVLAQDARLREHADRREAELRLIDQALHHPVTGLPNRTSFEVLVNDAVYNRSIAQYAVMVIQLSNYHAIQKTLGHANSESLMESFAHCIERHANGLPGVRPVEQSDRGQHLVASLESASFALLLDATRLREEPEAVFQFIEALREPFEFLGMQLPLNPLAGVAMFPEHGDDAGSLIRRAFIAQESEEAQHRHLAFYQPHRDPYSKERLTLASELRAALETGEMGLVFQPKYSLSEHQVTGLEALIRWPGRNDPPDPETVINVAEETGLIQPLTRWVIREALACQTRLVADGFPLNIAVNISANNLREPDFPLFVRKMTQGNRPGLTLELTETAMMTDPTSAMKALRELEEAGIPIAIDDFGSGYSSLSYIKRLPAREIKIDKTLITDITHHGDDQLIVKATIDMAHSLGYQVVAEGVEDEATLNWLRSLNCDAIQGYLLSHPMTLEDLVPWLNRGIQLPGSSNLHA